MPTTWTIAIDWDRNGDYAGTYDDVTTYVLQAQWQLGFAAPYQEVADDGIVDLILDNADRRFSPENASSPLFGKLKPLRPVRIQSNDGTTRTHFVGWIQSIQPYPGQYGEKRVHLKGAGAMQFLKVAETKLALQENKRADEILDLLMKEVIIPPALTRATFLNVPGSAEVGVSTYLTDGSGYKLFDSGIQTFTLAGDNWVNNGGYSDKPKDTFDVYRAMKDIVAAERGKFFFDRAGQAVFWNRHHLLLNPAAVATFNNTMQDLQYTYAGTERLKNDILVACHPRTVSTSNQDVLWELPDDSVIRVDAGKTRELYIKYEDPTTKKRIGAREVTLSDLSMEGGTVSPDLTARANGAELAFTNTGTTPVYITAAKVRGRKILDDGQMEARKEDGFSIAYHGRRTLRLNLASLDNLDEAEQIAEFEKQRRANPLGEVQNVLLKSHAKRGGGQHNQQLARTVGDKVTITETQTGHSASYWIIGEAHEIREFGQLYQTTWYLERVPDQVYVQVGTSTVGNTHVLAY